MARRVNIEALVRMHGAAGLARKLGVHTRTVFRWLNDAVDPSPLALEKLRALPIDPVDSNGHGSTNGNGNSHGPSEPVRQPADIPMGDTISAGAGSVPARRVE